MTASQQQKPHVSILIPNFNNGPSSSVSGSRDFFGDLLQSLQTTLEHDPTPVEIIIVDDGSTDESLQTARKWSKKTWSQGGRGAQPFCRLIELEHCGVLSKVANLLTTEAQGEILVRLDGDIVVHTPNWASVLKNTFENGPPTLGVVGPKQLAPDGNVHSAGDWLLHPRGYHHIGQGAPAHTITRSLEVDHVMGCFYCFKRAVWDSVGEYDETVLRGQTVDYTVRARLDGWRVWFIPTIEFTHYHSLRKKRENFADTHDGLYKTRRRFQEKWGFDRVVPDLDVVAEKYKGTPLLWNARVFGPDIVAQTAKVADAKPAALQTSRWHTFGENKTVQAIINAQLAMVEETVGPEAIANPADAQPIVQFGCGDGLLCHILAQRGFEVIGIDTDGSQIALAKQMSARATYPATGMKPRFVHQYDIKILPIDPEYCGLALVFHYLERHHNPVGLIKQVYKSLAMHGHALLVVGKRQTPLDNDVDCMHFYRPHELTGQLFSMSLLDVHEPPNHDTPIGLVRLLRKVEAKNNTKTQQESTAPTALIAK